MLLILLGLLVLVGVVAILGFRRYMRRWEEQASDPASSNFSLGDLRSLLLRGEMTEEEYERAKQSILSRASLPSDLRPRGPRGFDVLKQ